MSGFWLLDQPIKLSLFMIYAKLPSHYTHSAIIRMDKAHFPTFKAYFVFFYCFVTRKFVIFGAGKKFFKLGGVQTMKQFLHLVGPIEE